MIDTPSRLVLCRPQGGLSDMLSQIGRCCVYADQFKRHVIVETDFPHVAYFKDDFSHYFVSHDPDLPQNWWTPIIRSIETVEVFYENEEKVYGRVQG